MQCKYIHSSTYHNSLGLMSVKGRNSQRIFFCSRAIVLFLICSVDVIFFLSVHLVYFEALHQIAASYDSRESPKELRHIQTHEGMDGLPACLPTNWGNIRETCEAHPKPRQTGAYLSEQNPNNNQSVPGGANTHKHRAHFPSHARNKDPLFMAVVCFWGRMTHPIDGKLALITPLCGVSEGLSYQNQSIFINCLLSPAVLLLCLGPVS